MKGERHSPFIRFVARILIVIYCSVTFLPAIAQAQSLCVGSKNRCEKYLSTPFSTYRSIQQDESQYRTEESPFAQYWPTQNIGESGKQLCLKGVCTQFWAQIEPSQPSVESGINPDGGTTWGKMSVIVKGDVASAEWGRYTLNNTTPWWVPSSAKWAFWGTLMGWYSYSIDYYNDRPCQFDKNDVTTSVETISDNPKVQKFTWYTNRFQKMLYTRTDGKKVADEYLCVLRLTDHNGAYRDVYEFLTPKFPPVPTIKSFTANGSENEVYLNPGAKLDVHWNIENGVQMLLQGYKGDNADTITDTGNNHEFDSSVQNLMKYSMDGSFSFPNKKVYRDRLYQIYACNGGGCSSTKNLKVKMKPINFPPPTYRVTGNRQITVDVHAEGAVAMVIMCESSYWRACEPKTYDFAGGEDMSITLDSVDVGDTRIVLMVTDGSGTDAGIRRQDLHVRGNDLGQCMGNGINNHFKIDTSGVLSTLNTVTTYGGMFMCIFNGIKGSKTQLGALGAGASCLLSEVYAGAVEGINNCSGDVARAASCSIQAMQLVNERLSIPGHGSTSLVQVIIEGFSIAGLLEALLTIAGVSIGSGIIAGGVCLYDADILPNVLNSIRQFIRYVNTAVAGLDFLSQFDFVNKLAAQYVPNLIPPEARSKLEILKCIDGKTCSDDVDWSKHPSSNPPGQVTADPPSDKAPSAPVKVGPAIVGDGFACLPFLSDSYEKCASNALQVACAVLGFPISRDQSINKVRSAPDEGDKSAADTINFLVPFVAGSLQTLKRDKAEMIVKRAGGCPNPAW